MIATFFQNRIVLLLFRLAIAGVFIYTGVRKIISPLAFADSIATFQLVPKVMISLVALSLPPVELILGLAILIGIQRRPALLGIVILAVIFMLALLSAIVRGIPIDCGCFRSGEPSTAQTWIALGRDIPLLAAALWLYLRELLHIDDLK